MKRKLIGWVVAVVGGGLPVLAGGMAVIILLTVLSVTTDQQGSASTSVVASMCTVDPMKITVTQVGIYGRGSAPGADDDQLYNASVIISVAARRGLDARDQQIGLMTAMQESGLRNLDYGDRDSLGLFQQRPSQGWGTADQVRNPYYAAGRFFDHLTAIADRASMNLNDAAQAVQRSGYPDAYAQHEQDAAAILTALYGDTEAVSCGSSGVALPLPAGSWVITARFCTNTVVNTCHTGVDFATAQGTPIYAVASGTVVFNGPSGTTFVCGAANFAACSGLGWVVKIDHGGGFVMVYAHQMEQSPYVFVGQTVNAGDRIGSVGSTGTATGPHLHLGLYVQGILQDPLAWLSEQGLSLE